MKPQPKFENGDIVKDSVSGYKGMVIATTLWMNGCYRYVVQARTLTKDGAPVGEINLDEHQLVMLKPTTREGVHDTGGPRPNVTHPTDVRR